MYYINSNYKKEVDKVLSAYNLNSLKKMLLDWGYCEEVLDDECHAYLSADYDWLFDTNGEDISKFNIKIDRSIHKKLRKIKYKYCGQTNQMGV
jgi:hypothetical protein